MRLKIYYLIFLLLFSTILSAQYNRGVINGIVNLENNPVAGVKITVENTQFSTVTDDSGKFSLRLPAGKHIIRFAGNEYNSEITIDIAKNEVIEVDVDLASPENSIILSTVEIRAKTPIEKIKETPFNVVALDAKAFHNSTLDLGKLLDKASGVKIRETGGVGSDMSVTLNGFTGRHVKLFMDGVPMEGFGSSFQLNNIPVGIADRIEVYKGVVPIEFGADALGGVINIVTNQSANSYLDASYSFGSFNTHKSSLSMGHTTKSGLTAQLSLFQNYSDNDYKVKTKVLNLETGNRLDDLHWVRRFNDAYHNETVMAKVGFVNQPWADRFLLGFTYGQEYQEIQSANDMRFVYGERNRTAMSMLHSLSYEKRNLFTKGLSVKINANYNISNNNNYDTINRQYNWFGEYITSNTMGEYGQSTLSQFKNKNISATGNINYQINRKHSFSINNVINNYSRTNTDPATIADPETSLDSITRENTKNVLGVSYRYRHNDKFNVNIFGKNYNQHVTGPVNISTMTNREEYEEQNRSYNITGYGIATTYFFKDIQLKASVEKAYRLPSDTELFGDDVLETGNTTLQAEDSWNYNVGATLNKNINQEHSLYIDVNGYYRDTKDFIQRITDQRYGSNGSFNHGKVKNFGVDAEVRYYYKNKLSVGGNVTYMDLRDYERYESDIGSTRESNSYKTRMPNIPYFFGNADASYYFHDLGGKGNTLTVGYVFNFIYEFYLKPENLGAVDTKSTLPTQTFSDINVVYSFKNGRYNVAFEARNIENELLYDNFSLQKPGRSFAVKFRYFLMKRN